MTDSGKERNILSSIKGFSYMAGMRLFNMAAPLFLASAVTPLNGYYGLIFTGVGIIMVLSTIGVLGIHERIEPVNKDEKYRLRDIIPILTSRPVLITFIATIISSTAQAIANGSNIYFISYILNRRFDVMSRSFLFSLMGMLPVMVIMPFLANRFGKKSIYIIGLACSGLFPLIRLFSLTNIPLIYVAVTGAGIGGGLTMALRYGIQADNVDYVEYTRKQRAEGAVASIQSFVMKAGMGIGGAVPGYILAATGYIPNQPQAESAKTGIIASVIVIPACVFLLSLLVFGLGYNINREKLAEITQSLRAKRAAKTARKSGFLRSIDRKNPQFEQALTKPPVEYWPELRWWLAEGFHTDETLTKDIETLYRAGFGAVEFLAMDEPGVDHATYGWGSEEWGHDSYTIIREASARKMGASFTSGANWSTANLLTIRPDDQAASKELDYTVEHLSGGCSRSGPLQKAAVSKPGVQAQELVAVVAARKTGETDGIIFLDTNSVVPLNGAVIAGNLDWTAPTGEWELFTFWLHGTGQTAAPSAGVSYAINYLDRYGIDALVDYWNREVLSEDMRKLIRQNGRLQMYMDSLELSTCGRAAQIWAYHFNDEFKQRRGYDITPYLPFVPKAAAFFGGPGTYQYHYEPNPADPDAVLFVRKLRNDLYQTMTDLYIGNMINPMREWLHSLGMALRVEISYGMPFEISIPGKYVDGIETESLEFAGQIEPYRNLAGPAHICGKPYSSETGASKMNYQMGMDFYTQIIYTQFAAGVTRTVLHGYSSISGAEEATRWPGHEGMWPLFSERFGDRQPAFRHYSEWTAMIARYQMFLRRGKPQVDLGIVRLDYNFNNLYASMGKGKTEKEFYETELMRANRGVYWQDMGLQNAGFTYDYFAPQLLEDESVIFFGGELCPEGPGYRALIIYQEEMPLASAKKIFELARAGLPVVIVHGVTEQLRPALFRTNRRAASLTPFNNESDADLAELINELKSFPNVREIERQSETLQTLVELGVFPRVSFAEPNKTILTSLRSDGDNTYIFMYNYMYTRKNPCNFSICVEGGGTPYRIDCWIGEAVKMNPYESTSGCTTVPLSLMPGEAALIALRPTGEESGRKTVFQNTHLLSSIILDQWELEVEDWNEGAKKTRIEDRGLGTVTREVYFETTKTMIPVGRTELKPWKDIPAIGPAVSGIGYYTSAFTLPSDRTVAGVALLRIGSTNGNSAAVYVNDIKAPPYDFNKKSLDISALLKTGENTIKIEVASTLNNRLLARNYHAVIDQMLKARMTHISNPVKPSFITPGVQDYGLLGPVRIDFYQE
jgi:hypothetical protein